MVKKEITESEIIESIADIWKLLTDEQRATLRQNFTVQKYKKNETIYCEGETPTHMLCLLSGKVKIYKDGVGGRSQIIRVIKPVEYFAYRAFFSGGSYSYGNYQQDGIRKQPTSHVFHPSVSYRFRYC